ncbi:hypothetical protein KBY25_11375 [Ruegeria pomeroyi]|nr:hypothetical protein [Ruegeria pomeroyi]
MARRAVDDADLAFAQNFLIDAVQPAVAALSARDDLGFVTIVNPGSAGLSIVANRGLTAA